MAAEARVAQASEAAKEAEERAASAAAHATAYQDMSQSQVGRVRKVSASESTDIWAKQANGAKDAKQILRYTIHAHAYCALLALLWVPPS